MKRRLLIAGLLGFAFLGGAGLGEAAPPASRKSEGWKRQVQAGVHIIEGNKDSTDTRVQVSAKGSGTNWTCELKLRGEIGEISGERSRKRVLAEAVYEKQMSFRSYSVNRLDFLYDGIANLDYRVVVSPSWGYYVLRDASQQLRAEVGPAGVVESKNNEREAYPALRLAEYYECPLTSISRVLQGIEYLPELRTGSGAYLVKASVELKADLDTQLGLHVRLESEYDSQPADGKEKQDTTFSVSMSYSF